MNKESPALLTAEEIQAQLPDNCHIDATGNVTQQDLDIILSGIAGILESKKAGKQPAAASIPTENRSREFEEYLMDIGVRV